MKSRTLSARRTTGQRWLALLLALAMLCPALAAPAAVSAEGPQPGATNPAQTYAKWPDDEVFMPTAVVNNTGFQMASYQSGGAQQAAGAFPASSFHDAIAPAAGRILTAEHDSLLYAYHSGPAYDLSINAWRAGTLTPVYTFANANMALRVNGGTDLFDMAAGDLDGLPTQDGEYRDEVVVAYPYWVTNDHDPVKVSVLDFSGATEAAPAPTAVTTATGSNTLDRFDIASFYIKPVDNALAVATGDFDNNGLREIAVAYLSSRTALTVDVFRYSAALGNNGVTTRRLALIGTGSIPLASGHEWNETISLAAGDFDGDGRDELALGTVDRATSGDTQTVHVRLLRLTGATTLTVSQVNEAIPCTGPGGGAYWRVQLAAGLFKFDPANGYNLNRRQLAVAYNNGSSTYRSIVYIQTIDVDASLNPGTPSAAFTWETYSNFWLAAGRFTGPPTSTDPYWSLLFSYYQDMLDGFQVLQVGSDGAAPHRILTTYPFPLVGMSGPGVRLPAIAMDYDGDSMFLGAPVHLTVENVVGTDFILEEPPKHAYWDPVTKQVVNVSRFDDFAISLYSSSGQEFSTTTKDTSALSVGASASLSASHTAEAHGNVGVATVSEAASQEVTAKIGYDYQNNQANYNSNYADRKAFYSGRTDRDDFIVGRLQIFDIWRYRVFGSTVKDAQGNPANAFIDLVLPGPYDNLSTQAGGLNFDWYQPPHENGNILSYPAFDPSFVNPPDLGSYKIPCPDPAGEGCNEDGTKTVSGVMYDPVLMFWDQTSNLPGGSGLQFSTASGGGAERSSSNTLSENLSIKASTTTKATVGTKQVGASAAVAYSVQFDQNSKLTWGTSTVSNNKTTNSTGITIYKRAGTSEKAYGFYPIIYETTDGTIKATYAADPLASNTGKTWWIANYGQKPDLALNLPTRFQPSVTPAGLPIWVPTMSALRKQMRGLFTFKNEIDPATGRYIPLSEAATDGEAVRLEARVYNYGVTQGVPAGAQACFDASPYDPLTDTETPGQRARIGCTTLPYLAPRQMTTASIVWDTTGFGKGATQGYRIYVVLDPDNKVDEKYETESTATETYCDAATGTCVDPGQNNEGFGYAEVTAKLPAGPGGGKQAHLSIPKGGLAAVDRRGKLATGNVQAYLGQPLHVRIKIDSDQMTDDYSTILVYDGDPNRGGKLIAGKRVFSGSTAGNAAWFDWIPTERGQHRLFARLLQSQFDPTPGNNLGDLKVEVIKGK